ncbi:MAG: permease, partial [Acidobacteriota bacterium]|nr:permease [Acidobacteriota bacterium]
MKETKIFLILLAVFLTAYFVPFSQPAVQNAIVEAFLMLQEYARLHVLSCLVPAFFIAGAISVFIRKESVIR